MPIAVKELMTALLQREPTDTEEVYWKEQIETQGFESVFRRFTASEEHKRFSNDKRQMFVPAGHFYSPIVDQDFVSARRDAIYTTAPRADGVDLNEPEQLKFLSDIAKTATWLPFQREKIDGLRYYYENGAFLYGDAIAYASMLDKHRPSRIMEVGSGFSSALALDVIDRIDGYDPEIHFIDPYPQLVQQLVGDHERDKVKITGAFIQDVDPTVFDVLEAGDFYFMDTTHIVKTGSDVLHHFEKILPRLKSGVIIHLHDIFFPFEYPPSWIFDMKLSWNEIYYFRAFMVNNPEYEILYFNSFMQQMHLDRVLAASPLFNFNAGASIWFRKK
jgi:hypothetical protein